MQTTESMRDFYLRAMETDPSHAVLHNAGLGHFNVFTRGACRKSPYGRRDFYKISLVSGTGKYTYSDKSIVLDKPALVFFNPFTPYAWEAVSDEQKGCYCVFTEEFLHPGEKKDMLQDSPLYRHGQIPAFFLNKVQQEEIGNIYSKMMEEMASDYIHKFDVLRNYLHLLIHTAMKMQPIEAVEKTISASSRITHLFFELQERQFPIDAPEEPLRLKTANQYAEALAIHVNHLNRALKEVTGKTTTEHLSARIISEAKALLKHSDWNIAEIAYGLGFEYPAYFTLFFKKQTGLTPIEARMSVV
jgi:AraC-like DNA-binding protein